MARKDPPTVKMQSSVPLVLLVGASAELAARCKPLAASHGAVLKACDVASAATMAARWRPEVILVSEAAHAFDPAEWEALARDVRAALVSVEAEGIADAALAALLLEGIATAQEIRSRS